MNEEILFHIIILFSSVVLFNYFVTVDFVTEGKMQKSVGSMPSYHGPPPAAPPSYSQAVGGVPPTSPYTPVEPGKALLY